MVVWSMHVITCIPSIAPFNLCIVRLFKVVEMRSNFGYLVKYDHGGEQPVFAKARLEVPKAEAAALEEVTLLHEGVGLLPGRRVSRRKRQFLEYEDGVKQERLPQREVVVQHLRQGREESVHRRCGPDFAWHHLGSFIVVSLGYTAKGQVGT